MREGGSTLPVAAQTPCGRLQASPEICLVLPSYLQRALGAGECGREPIDALEVFEVRPGRQQAWAERGPIPHGQPRSL